MGKYISKILVTIFSIMGVKVIDSVFKPTLTNEMAVNHLSNSNSSFTDWQLYNQFQGWLWIIPVIVFVSLFFSDFKKLSKQIKNKKEI